MYIYIYYYTYIFIQCDICKYMVVYVIYTMIFITHTYIFRGHRYQWTVATRPVCGGGHVQHHAYVCTMRYTIYIHIIYMYVYTYVCTYNIYIDIYIY